MAPNKTLTGAPYPSGSLHPPLSPTQETKIIAYLQTKNYTLIDITRYVSTAATSQTKGALDGALISMYNTVSTGGGVNISSDITNTTIAQYVWGKYLNPWTASEPGGWLYNENQAVGKSVKNAPGVSQALSGVDAIGSFTNKLSSANTWIRVAEFAAGGILLAVGASAALKVAKGSSAGQATRSTAGNVKKAVKYVR